MAIFINLVSPQGFPRHQGIAQMPGHHSVVLDDIVFDDCLKRGIAIDHIQAGPGYCPSRVFGGLENTLGFKTKVSALDFFLLFIDSGESIEGHPMDTVFLYDTKREYPAQ